MQSHFKIVAIAIAAATIAAMVGTEPAGAGGATNPAPSRSTTAADRLLYSCNYVTSGTLCGVETFSRAGANASMFDSTGRLTFAPNNLLLHSNAFLDAVWARASAALTPDATTDPFGGKAAWSVQSTSARGGHLQQSVNVEPGLRYVNTLYLAPGTATWAQIDRYDGSAHPSWINLSTCAAGTTAPGTNLKATTVAGRWCKIDQAFIPAGSTVRLSFAPAMQDKSESVSGAAFYAFGQQLSLVTYQTTTERYHPTGAAAYFGPRFGHVHNGSAWIPAGLLLEDFRVNYVRFSNDLTNPAWVRGATMKVARDQTGVDGVVNGASSLTGGAVSATNTICQNARVSFHDRVLSAYVKRLSGGGVVNMATDATNMKGAGATWHAMPVTPDWTRVSFAQEKVTNPITCFQLVGNGDKIAVQYVQNESVPNEGGAPVATSPIATASSVGSRAAESLTSDSPALLKANAFVVETSGHFPAMDLAMLGLANLRDELSIGIGENTDNRLYSTFPFPSISTANAADWSAINRAGVAWGSGPAWIAISLNGGEAAAGDGDYDALTKIYWGQEPGGGKACNCFIRSWAAYSSLSKSELSAKSIAGAPF